MIWKRGKPIPSLIIHNVWVKISPQTIGRVFFGLIYQASANNAEMDYKMAKLWKLTNQILGMDD